MVNLKTYGKVLKSLWLPNTSGGCIVGALAENQMVNTDNNSILRTCKNFYLNLVILPLIAPLEYLKNFKLDSTTEDSLFKCYWKMLRSQKQHAMIKYQENFEKIGCEFWQNLLVRYAFFHDLKKFSWCL